jgi:salicylate hydroxylase
MSNSPIAIIGGGIAGLASAIALGDRDCVILEQAEAFSNLGAGLQLGPNAVRALQKLGAWDAVEPITSSPPEIHMRDGLTGKVLHKLKLGENFETRFGAPYRVALRADLHQALLDVVNTKTNITIKTGESVSSVETHANGVRVLSNGNSVATTSAIITDGVKSALRQKLFEGSGAVDSGSIFHRATFPKPNVSEIDFDCVNVWFYPAGHVVHYRVGAAQHVNLVAITPKSVSPQQHFANAAPALQTLLQQSYTTWPGLYIEPLRQWAYENILLLGDAAHATLPYLAQGAAMSLEDAACLKSVLSKTENMKQVFTETAQQRMLRTKKLHLATLSAGRTYHLSGAMRLARNAVLQAMPSTLIQTKMNWIYKG